MTLSDDTQKQLEAALKSVGEYRNSVLTASGLLITVPFLAESILVAFGHFSQFGIVMLTIPMFGSAAFFSLAIYLIVSSYQKMASASATEFSISFVLNYPQELMKQIPLQTRQELIKDAPTLIKQPFDLRTRSSLLFRASVQAFELGVFLLLISLGILALNLIS